VSLVMVSAAFVMVILIMMTLLALVTFQSAGHRLDSNWDYLGLTHDEVCNGAGAG